MRRTPFLIFMIGISGSGKSRKARSLSQQFKAIIVSSDNLRIELSGDINNQEITPEVWKKAKERTTHLLTKGSNVILDATNLESEKRKEFIEGLPPCKLKAKVLDVDIDIAKYRVIKDIRERKNRSNVPLHIIEQQYELFLRDREKLSEEGFELLP